MRKIAFTMLAGLMVLGAAISTPAATTVSAYTARGRTAIRPGSTERPGTFVATASLTQVGRGDAIGVAPARGTLSLTGVVRSHLYPPNPCLGLVAAGSLTITWSDGSRSRGTFTAVVAGPVLTWLGNIGSGRFRGALVDGGSLVGLHPQREPPSCSAPFTGAVVLVDPS